MSPQVETEGRAGPDRDPACCELSRFAAWRREPVQIGRVRSSASQGSFRAAERVLPEKHWRTAFYRLHLTRYKIGANQLDGTEADLKSSYETLRKQLGRSHPTTFEVLTTLVDYYEATGRPERAAEFRALIPATPDTEAPPSGNLP